MCRMTSRRVTPAMSRRILVTRNHLHKRAQMSMHRHPHPFVHQLHHPFQNSDAVHALERNPKSSVTVVQAKAPPLVDRRKTLMHCRSEFRKELLGEMLLRQGERRMENGWR